MVIKPQILTKILPGNSSLSKYSDKIEYTTSQIEAVAKSINPWLHGHLRQSFSPRLDGCDSFTG